MPPLLPTLSVLPSGGIPEDFYDVHLNRPFIFVCGKMILPPPPTGKKVLDVCTFAIVHGHSGLPMFVGVVNECRR